MLNAHFTHISVTPDIKPQQGKDRSQTEHRPAGVSYNYICLHWGSIPSHTTHTSTDLYPISLRTFFTTHLNISYIY